MKQSVLLGKKKKEEEEGNQEKVWCDNDKCPMMRNIDV